MNIHTIQFNIGDFLSGVMQMDAVEIGAYTMLIMAHYQTGVEGIEDNDATLRMITKTTPKVWKRIKDKVMKKFDLIDGYWKHDRIINDVEKMQAKSEKKPSKDDIGIPKKTVEKPLLASQVENKSLNLNEKDLPNTIPNTQYPIKDKKLIKKKSEFEEFWKLCPRKVGKGDAEGKYWKARQSETHELLMSAMARHAREVKGKEREYIPHPATWLSKKRYFDEPETPDIEPITDWPQWKHKLAAKIGEDNVKSWFTGAIANDRGIYVAKRFNLERINERYLPAIKSAFGEDYEVKMRTK